jgi:DMSO/TMAO reductase YedYZ molybdopterin-dependent catalytic subunit
VDTGAQRPAPPRRRSSAAAPSRPDFSLDKPIGRRVLLGILGLGVVGVATGSSIQNGLDSVLAPLRTSGLGSLLPGGGGFTLYTVTNGFPAAPANYRLQVGGLVDRPMSLSVADLRSLPATRLDRDFQCVTGWRVDGVHWVGVSLVDLAARAGITNRATAFRFASFDGVYTESLTLEQAHQSGAIVAYEMLGAPVTRDHGGPVRLYVPAMFGYKSIKWLSVIEAVDQVQLGYWEVNGYPVNAWIDGHPPSTGA